MPLVTTLLPWLLAPLFALLVASLAASSAGFVVQAVERQERYPWTPDRVALLARETMSRLLFGLLRPIAWFDAPLPGAQGESTPILLVPSPLWSRATLSFLHTYLERRGHRVWSMSFPREDQTLSERAAVLEAALTRLTKATRARQVDVVAHGLGGLIAGWVVQHGETRDQVRRLITLGTPWRGTRMAVFFAGHIAREAAPQSVNLDGLLPLEVPTLSVWCPEDPIVIPADSAVADPLSCVAIDGVGHLGLLASARCFRAVQSALDASPGASS